jgi:hypothetical protein
MSLICIMLGSRISSIPSEVGRLEHGYRLSDFQVLAHLRHCSINNSLNKLRRNIIVAMPQANIRLVRQSSQFK